MPNIDALLSRAGSLGMLGLLGLGVIVVLLFSFELGCVFFFRLWNMHRGRCISGGQTARGPDDEPVGIKVDHSHRADMATVSSLRSREGGNHVLSTHEQKWKYRLLRIKNKGRNLHGLASRC